MIKTKSDLKRFLLEDKKALGKLKFKRPRIFRDEEWRFQILLRKTEYHFNKNSLFKFFYLIRYRRLQVKYLTFIPLNTCDYGLSIAHIGGIRINNESKIGKYCRIHEGVTIGATNGDKKAPVIGDKVFIGSGAKIIGNIIINGGCCIGAGAVVVKDIMEIGTYAGVPVKKISNKNSSYNLLIEN